MSLFITFEGGEGSGKSTQAELLYKQLQTSGLAALLTREPGGRLSGAYFRSPQVVEDRPVTPVTELLLFNASRAQLVEAIIRPALASERS